MSTFKRLLPLFIGLSLAIVTLSFAPAASADTSTVSLSVQAGTRTASLANATLSQISYAHTNQHQTGSVTLSADDSTGSGAGWNVTVLSSDFVYSGANGGTDIPAANFAISQANTPALVVGQAVDATDGPRPGASAASSLDQARKVIFANAGFGQGSYTQVLDVDLLVPGLVRAGSYTGTLTVTVASGPGA